MNPEIFKRIQQQIGDLSEKYETVLSILKAHDIDDQLYLKKNPMITPGIGTKVYYDMNGLIVRSDRLSAEDIPELSIDHIKDLRTILNDKAPLKATLSVNATSPRLLNPTVAGTATKVNYNDQGIIIDSCELLPEDIPMLPVSKIEGLPDVVDYINSFGINPIADVIDHPSVSPGVYTKVTVNKDGHITHGGMLEMDDIPYALITRMNELETRMTSYTPGTSFDMLSKLVNTKMDKNPVNVVPGTYMKVSVNKDGLVTGGSNVTLSDFPEIGIGDVTHLRSELSQKASTEEVANLNMMISRMTKTISQVGEVLNLTTEVKNKANQKDLADLENKVNTMTRTYETLIDNFDSDTIQAEVIQLKSTISEFIGRLDTLERIVRSLTVDNP